MPPTDKPVSRREFARRIALGAASTSLLPLREFVPAAAKSESPRPAPAPAQSPPGAAKLSPQSQAEAESRFQSIVQQYPDRFSEAQKTDLKRLSLFIQPSLDRIRAYGISNSDLPALYLKPLVDRDKKPSPAAAAKNSATPAKKTAPAKP